MPQINVKKFSKEINGIQFTEISPTVISLGGTTSPRAYNSNTYDNYGKTPIINAVDIDWNGAKVDENTSITTSGSLLNWIIYKFENINSTSGNDGINGENGKSAYELWKETPMVGDIYSFISYGDEGAQTKYGEGTVEVTELRNDGAKVKVLTNIAEDANAANFVGQEFNVTSLNESSTLRLYSILGLAQDIWVKVTKNVMTQEEWLASLKGPQGEKGDTGTFGDSVLENYATKEELSSVDNELEGKADSTNVYTKAETNKLLAESEDLTKVELDEVKSDKGIGYMIIANEDDWNNAYNDGNGPLAKYYADYPDEDRWNGTSHANINDKVVEVTIENIPENKTYQGFWVNGHITGITIIETSEVYYIERGNTLPQPTANIEYDLYTCIDIDNSFSDDDTITSDKLQKVENKKIIFAKGLDDWRETPACQIITLGVDKNLQIHWVNDTIYSLTNVENNSEVYYVNSIAIGSHDFYEALVGVPVNDWNTVASYSLLDTNKFEKVADKVLKINNVKWSNSCTICWKGVVSANNVMLPWVLVYFNEDVNANIEVEYNGKTVKPWGYKVFGNENGHKTWGLASIAEEFKDKSLLNEHSGNYTTDLDAKMISWADSNEEFNSNNLNVKLVHNYYVKFEDYLNLLDRVKALENKLS